MGGSGAGCPRSLDARGLGARSLDGWHAARELGARRVGWVARGLGAGGPRARGSGVAGTRFWSWGPAEFGWLARGVGVGDAALELRARGVWMAHGPTFGPTLVWPLCFEFVFYSN